MKLNALGASRPKSDGPRRMPATISPITAGCPQRLKSQATTAEALMTTKSCKNSRLSGLVAFCNKLDFTVAKNEESLTLIECGAGAATGSVESRETGEGS